MSNVITIDLDKFVGKTIHDLKKHIVDEISAVTVSFSAASPVYPLRVIETSVFDGKKDYTHKNGREVIAAISLDKS